MFAVVQNGAVRQVLQMDTEFTIGEKKYSSAFLRTSTAQEKLEAGVWEIIDGPRPDDRFYWVSGPSYHVNEVDSIVEASYPATPKDLDGLKTQFVGQAKSIANSMLAATDWMVIRKLERNVELSAEAAAERAQIVADCNTKESAINAATTVEELIAALGA